MKFTYQHEDGHVIVEHDGRRMLIDTGSPHSYGVTGIRIGAIALPDRPFPANIAELLQDNVSGRIDVLLGMDVLSRYEVSFASAKRMVSFGPGPERRRGPWDGVLEIASIEGLPVIEVEGRRRLKVLLDTGAKYSYLPGASLRSLGTHTDFLLGSGRFDTELHTIEVGVGGRRLRFSSGVPPASLGALLRAVEVDGILGSALLDFGDVQLDFPNRVMRVGWHQQPLR